jgi:hypothetical protein
VILKRVKKRFSSKLHPLFAIVTNFLNQLILMLNRANYYYPSWLVVFSACDKFLVEQLHVQKQSRDEYW